MFAATKSNWTVFEATFSYLFVVILWSFGVYYVSIFRSDYDQGSVDFLSDATLIRERSEFNEIKWLHRGRPVSYTCRGSFLQKDSKLIYASHLRRNHFCRVETERWNKKMKVDYSFLCRFKDVTAKKRKRKNWTSFASSIIQ